MIPTLNVLGRHALGQAPGEWSRRAWSAVTTFDELMAQSAHINDESARGEIMSWVGRSDVPGSPAERYLKVVTDIDEDPERVYASEMEQRRVVDLEAAVSEFHQRTTEAANTYGLLPGSADVARPPAVPPRALPTFILASIAVLGLALPVVYG